MNIDRLPTSPNESPALLAHFDEAKNKVSWAVDGEPFYDCPQFMDGSAWFQVWREGRKIHCQATQWYGPSGDFCLRVTDMSPEEAVYVAAKSADLAGEFISGDKKLEKSS